MKYILHFRILKIKTKSALVHFRKKCFLFYLHLDIRTTFRNVSYINYSFRNKNPSFDWLIYWSNRGTNPTMNSHCVGIYKPLISTLKTKYLTIWIFSYQWTNVLFLADSHRNIRLKDTEGFFQCKDFGKSQCSILRQMVVALHLRFIFCGTKQVYCN